MKIVVNRCFGGFGLSLKAVKKYMELKGKEVYAYKQTKYNWEDGVEEYTKIKSVDDDTDRLIYYYTIDLGDVVDKFPSHSKYHFLEFDIDRNDPDLVKVVESLGDEANGAHAELEVVEIPDEVEWEIDEYDGSESVCEKHRSW